MKMSETSAINHNSAQVINMQYVKVVFHIRGEMWEKINYFFTSKFRVFPNML